VLDALEAAHGVRLGLELQVETPQAVLGPDGAVTLAQMVHAAGPRILGLHYGTYDYSAALGIAAAHQASDHPAADLAKELMQVAVAGTKARAVDGSTNVLPAGDRAQVHAAWRLHAGLVRRALERGLYQGWDLHPAQLVTRYVATYAFFRDALPAAAARLAAYLHRRDAGVLDEPATARALAGVLVRGLDCGALDEADISAAGAPGQDDLARVAGR
jgi:citrate lyase beta subunit